MLNAGDAALRAVGASPKASPKRTWRHRAKRVSANLFMTLDRFGVHVLPKHYYTPIPDYSWLRRNIGAWANRSPLRGVHWDLNEQLNWLAEMCRPYYHEVAGLHIYRNSQGFGPGFGPIESQVLHCVIRKLCPLRIVEIGSGASTACMVHAVTRNQAEGKPGARITCIEPYPSQALRELEHVVLIEQPCQVVSASIFEQLEPGDLLFIDSSHAVKIGSELPRVYLDIIPSLPAGVLIHIHDIYLPYLYPTTALLDYFGWQETVLLLALLTNNDRLSVLASLSALHHDKAGDLANVLPDYEPMVTPNGLVASYEEPGHFPSSCWLCTN